MIRVSNLSKAYVTPYGQIPALRNVSLDIATGDIFGVIGFSGAGKSTLIRCLNRLEEPDSGRVFIGDQDITTLDQYQLRQARRRIGMIFQHFNLLDSRTVFENVAFPLEIASVKRQQINQRVSEIIELVGLGDKARAYPSQLSGGQKQRVGIARALANEPQVLLSDEATSSLDPQTTYSILQLLRELNQRLNLTIVMITHELEVLRYTCNNMAVLEEGAIV